MPIRKRRHKSIILYSSALVVLYSIYVLIYGWGLREGIFDVEVLGQLPMANDSAVCFIFISFALLFAALFMSRRSFLVSRILSCLVIVWASMLLIRDFTPIKIELIFGMSPQTAVCFILLGISLFFIKNSRQRRVIQGILHFVTIVGSIVVLGHLLNVPEFYQMSVIPMAIYSGVAFVILSAAASFVHYDVGITGLFTGKLIGNIMARRLFLKMLIAILAIGYLRLLSHRLAWLSTELGIALITVSFILISLFLIWSTSKTLNSIQIKRKMAEENFRTAVEAAPYALVISDRGGTIIMANDQTKELYGYKKSKLVGRNVKSLIPERLHEPYKNNRNNFFASRSPLKLADGEEAYAKRKDGSEFPVEIILTPVRTSLDTFVLATIIDITERKNQEQIIRKQLIELQQKNEELEQFNYISSHDLQEPLRTVSNYINLLEEDYPEQLNDEIRAHLGAMGSAIERMRQVVKSLLEFGKLGRKKKLVLTNCRSILDHVTNDLGSLIKDTGAHISLQCGISEFYAYETELRQLFQNLINNAVKFSRDGIQPEIKIKCVKEDDYYQFSVSDNGIGINPEHSEKIFNIFHRINPDDQYEGHGIGLANCKKIAEMHGGKIWVESVPGHGSTFKFTIFDFKYEQ